MRYSKLLVVNLIAGYVTSAITTLVAATHEFFGNNVLDEIVKINVTPEINEKYVDTKQSVYTRELPKYNSVIAGEIVDFKTTLGKIFCFCSCFWFKCRYERRNTEKAYEN